jgi:hypothetical protein
VLVEGGGRLVEQQHLGVERERPRQHHPLLLADGEPRGRPVGVRGVEAGVGEQPRDVDGASEQPRAVRHVVGDRLRQRRRQLRHQHDPAPQRDRVAVADVLPTEQHLAPRRVREPVQQAQQRRLPRSRRPDQRRRTIRDLARRTPQHRDPVALEPHVAEGEEGRRHPPILPTPPRVGTVPFTLRGQTP